MLLRVSIILMDKDDEGLTWLEIRSVNAPPPTHTHTPNGFTVTIV